MRKIIPLLIAVLAAAGLVTVTGISPVSAGAGGETTDVYAVHGLNLGGQTAQADGGTNVTVCAADTNPALIGDFAFGDVVGPVPVPTGSSLPLTVYLGAGVDCETPGGATVVIDQTIASVPAGTVAAIATQGPASQAPEILPVVLDAESAVADSGRLTGVHAANAPSVDALVNTAAAGSLVYGEDLTADLPADTYSVQVNLGATPIVGPADIPVTAGNNTIVYVVGNQPGDEATPVVPLVQNLAIPTCEVAIAPTTTTPQTPAAAPVAAQPTFTG